MAGYVVECALKACIAKRFQADHIPDTNGINKIYSHRAAGLLVLAKLEVEQATESQKDPFFRQNWATVQGWDPEERYGLNRTQPEAESMVNAVTDSEHGVLQWLKRHW